MVLRQMGDESAPGVAFIARPATGEKSSTANTSQRQGGRPSVAGISHAEKKIAEMQKNRRTCRRPTGTVVISRQARTALQGRAGHRVPPSRRASSGLLQTATNGKRTGLFDRRALPSAWSGRSHQIEGCPQRGDSAVTICESTAANRIFDLEAKRKAKRVLAKGTTRHRRPPPPER